MNGGAGNLLLNKLHIASAFTPRDIDTLPTEDYVSLSNYEHGGVLITCGVVGATFDLTLKQAQGVGGTGEKELVFTKAYKVANLAGAGALADKWEEATVTSPGVTGAKIAVGAAEDQSMFFIPFHAAMLDIDNDFTALRVDVSDPGAASFIVGHYLLGGARYGGPIATHVSAVVD